MHHNVQRCTRQSAKFRSEHLAAKDCMHCIACHLEQTHELAHIIPAIVIGTRHTDQIDRIHLRLLPLRQEHRKCSVRRLVPSVRKAANQSARVKRDNRTGDPGSACNRLDIIPDQPCRTAADDGKQRRRLLHIGDKCIVQIFLRAEYNRVVVELRTDHTMRDRALAMLDVTHRKEITPKRAVDDNDRILNPCEERRCTCKSAGVRAHADIIEGFFALIHRSALPCSHACAGSDAYHRAGAAPSTNRPTAAARERAGAASHRRVRAS